MDVKKLTLDSFSKYGRFVNLLDPQSPYIGESPIEFFRDSMVIPFSSSSLAVSVTVAERREFIVDVLEYHSYTGECFMNIDFDGIFAVAPATKEDVPNVKEIEFFEAPKGTAIYLAPGVWHHAPYSLCDEAVHSLVLLPERTYKNDCISYFLRKEELVSL